MEIENGLHQLETLLEATVDKAFDKFEIYVLRNILTVPEDLVGWIRLSHYEVCVHACRSVSRPPGARVDFFWSVYVLNCPAGMGLLAHIRLVQIDRIFPLAIHPQVARRRNLSRSSGRDSARPENCSVRCSRNPHAIRLSSLNYVQCFRKLITIQSSKKEEGNKLSRNMHNFQTFPSFFRTLLPND